MELGRSQIGTAKSLAANLENWKFDLLRIPHDERKLYQSPNPYTKD